MMDPSAYESLLTNENTKSVLKKHDNKGTEDYTINDYRKKCSQLELRLAEESSNYNLEIGKLHEKISKIQSSFEKNELIRQKLEYELTVSQQETNKEKRKRAEDQKNFKYEIEQLQVHITSLQSKLEYSESELSEVKQEYELRLFKDEENLKKVEGSVRQVKKENEVIYQEKLAAEQLIIVWKNKHEEVLEKCQVIEKQFQDQSFTIQKLLKEGEYATTLESELVGKMKHLQDHIQNVEENIQAERAAHLETKFNTEVVQLKLKETESILEMEKVKLIESRQSLENADKKFRELEGAYHKERDNLNQYKLKFDKTKEELHLHKTQIAAKDKHLDGITAEVKNYNQHVSEVVEELDKTKETLVKIEKEKKKAYREVEYLMNNYKLVSDIVISPVKGCDAELSFLDIVHKLRQMMERFQDNVMDIQNKHKETLLMLDKLEQECSVHREVAWNKDRALEEAERLVKNAQNNLSKCQVKCASYEERINRLLKEDQNHKQIMDGKDTQILELKQQTCKTTFEVDQIYQVHMRNMQSIYDLLMRNPSSEESRINQGTFTVDELKDMIVNRINENSESLQVLSQKYQTLCEELKKGKEDLHHHKSGIKRLQKLNAQVLSQTEKSLTESQQISEKEKQKHQDEILVLKSRLKVLHEEHEHLLVKFQDVPVDQLSTILQRLDSYEQINYLNNLLSGVLWGILYQYHALVYQKKLINHMLQDAGLFKNEIIDIAQSLEEAITGRRNEKLVRRIPRNGIFKFRRYTIVVLAVNRLLKIKSSKTCCILQQKPSYGHNGLIFLDKVGSSAASLSGQLSKENTFQCKLPADSDLISIGKFYSHFLQHTGELLKTSSTLSFKESNYEDSLLGRLGNGLHRIIHRDNKKARYSNSETLVDILRQHILQFTSKLHQLEDSKRVEQEKYKEMKYKLRHQLDRHQNEAALRREEETTLKERIFELEERMKSMVYTEQFDEMCTDLKNALQREEDLQRLFGQQIKEIGHMGQRIEEHEICFDEKSHELSETYGVLRKTQLELKRTAESLKETKQKFSELKHERSHLQKNASEQETRLSAFLRDREILARYMRHVTTVIHNTKKEMIQSPDMLYNVLSQLIAQQDGQDEKPSCNEIDEKDVGAELKSPEMQLIENMVKVFLETHSESMVKFSVTLSEKDALQKQVLQLQDEVNLHKSHIRSLRERVTALFQQNISTDAKTLFMENPVTFGARHNGENEEAIFIPLQEH